MATFKGVVNKFGPTSRDLMFTLGYHTLSYLVLMY